MKKIFLFITALLLIASTAFAIPPLPPSISGGGTAYIAAGKTFTVNNTLTLSGADGAALVLTTSYTNNGGPGTITWPGPGATLTIPTGGGTLASAAFLAASTSPTASTIAEWDANSNLSANSLIEGYLATATSSATVTLTVASKRQQIFTGSVAQTVVLPVTSTLVLGQQFLIVNNSSATLTLQASDATTVQAMAASTWAIVTVNSTASTTNTAWNLNYAYLTPQSTTANYIVLATVTTNGTLTTTQLGGNYYINNTGASTAITMTLQQCGTGNAYSYAAEFGVTAAQYLWLTAYTGDAFRYNNTTGATTGYIRSNTLGTRWKITCNGNGYWDVHDLLGVLNYDQ